VLCNRYAHTIKVEGRSENAETRRAATSLHPPGLPMNFAPVANGQTAFNCCQSATSPRAICRRAVSSSAAISSRKTEPWSGSKFLSHHCASLAWSEGFNGSIAYSISANVDMSRAYC